MKKASAKIRRKVKVKFCRELNSLDSKMMTKSSRFQVKRSDSKSSKSK